MDLKFEGNQLQKNKEQRKAAEQYSNAIIQNPDDASLYANRAAAQFMMNLQELVIQDCEKGIQLDQHYSKLQIRLFKVQKILGKFSEGLYQISKVNNCINFKTDEKINLDLKDELNEFLKLNEEYNIANNYIKDKSQENAIDKIKILLKYCQKCENLQIILIESQININESYEAKKLIKSSIDNLPRISSNIKLIYLDAISDQFTGDMPQCQSKLDRLNKLDPQNNDLIQFNEYIENSEMKKTKANNAFKNNETENAIILYNEALKLESRNIDYNSKILGNLSACQEKKFMFNEAQNIICQAIELNQNNPKHYLRKGNILFHLEKYHESLKEYNFAKKLDNNLTDIDNKIKNCKIKIGFTDLETVGLKNVNLTNNLNIVKSAEDYFAHWCPPCRGFTPQLADAYKLVGDSRSFEVVFISCDKDISQFNEYFTTMPWLAIEQSNEQFRQYLSNRHGVNGIPALHKVDLKSGYIEKDWVNKLNQIINLK